jgi:NAD(P)H dehydrogenase (quinone)
MSSNPPQRRKVLVIYSHPKKHSLNHSLKEALIKGLKTFDAVVRVQDLHEEQFDPVLYDVEANDSDEVTIRLKENVAWANWLIFVTPMWWSHVPAMLKGYFDRIFTENFAFRYSQARIPEGLLDEKNALIIGTSDTPPLILSLSGRSMGFKSIVKGIFKLCGIRGARFKIFGSVLNSTQKNRKRWIETAEKIGERIAKPDSVALHIKKAVPALIKAIRFPLYSFVFFPILLGASVGASNTGRFYWPGFILAALTGLFAHIAVSFSNEVADESIDKHNLHRTMFNGGTGLLAKSHISKKILNLGWIFSAPIALLIPAVMIVHYRYHWIVIVSLGIALFLGLEYSLPPFRLSRIGLGELAAFVAYGVPFLSLGFFLQQIPGVVIGNALGDLRFYLLAIPVALSVTVTLSLTQIPDTEADKSHGKKSISVLLGPRNVLILCVFLILVVLGFFVSFIPFRILSLPYALAACLLPLATGAVIVTNMDAYKQPSGMKMINVMGLSVTSSVFSALVPAIYFLAHLGQPTIFS